jgi:hypothetical protein
VTATEARIAKEETIKKITEVRDALWIYAKITEGMGGKAELRLKKMVEMLDEAIKELVVGM